MLGRQCIKMAFLVLHKDMEWSRNGYGIGYLRHCATIFGTVRFLFRNFGPTAPASDNYSSAG